MNWLLLKNSLLVSGFALLLATSFGFVAALWLVGLESRRRLSMIGIAILSFALPPFLVTNCWLDLLGSNGALRMWLPFDILSPGGAVWILSLLLWPITMFAALSAWSRLQAAQLESDLALKGWRMIRALLLPMARGALAQAAVLTFVLALNNFTVPAILQVKVFPAEVWIRFNATLLPGRMLLRSWPLIAAPLVLLICFARTYFTWPRLEGPIQPSLFRQQLGRAWFYFCGGATLLLCLLAVGLPLFRLVSSKRTWMELPGALAANQTATRNSFWFATSAASIVVGLGLIRAMRLPWKPAESSSSRFRWSGFTPETLFWLPLLVPGVVVGLVLIFVLNRPWSWFLYQSSGVVILAFVIRYFAIGWNSVAYASRTVDRDLRDDARLNGASKWQMLRYVQWPQIAPQVAAAAYVIFLLCLWDIESMLLVWPPGGETLALSIFNLLHYGHNAQVNALCLALLALALVPLAIWGLLKTLRFRWSLSTGKRLVICGACIPLVLAGCSANHSSNDVPLDSQIFNHVQIIGHRGVGVGEFNKPRSVAVDRKDNFYVVDMTGRVQKFSPKGTAALSWQLPKTDLGNPKGMARDQNGNIIVVEPHYQRVNHFTVDGALLARWGEKGTNAGQFMLPRAVAMNSRGEIYVSEYGVTERVQRFRSVERSTTSPNQATFSVDFMNAFGMAGNAPGQFNRPEGLGIDNKDQLYVADSCNHRIQIFSSEGKFIRAYGKAGTRRGELSYPYDICVDAAGRQYVCEFGNSRIQVFDANDRSIEIIGGPGSEPGRFSNPWGVALDSAGNLYVADSQNHRVQKLIRNPQAAPKAQGSVAKAVPPPPGAYRPGLVFRWL